MLSNNEITEGLLIVVLGANFVLRKMHCDKLIDKMLSGSGGTAEKQRYEGTAGDSLASPDAFVPEEDTK